MKKECRGRHRRTGPRSAVRHRHQLSGHGAAYYPYLETTLTFAYAESGVTIQIPAHRWHRDHHRGPSTRSSRPRPAVQPGQDQLSAQRRAAAQRRRRRSLRQRRPRPRRVWKAPANVSVSAVIAPIVKISNDAQEGLNVDPTAGKSVNAIRAFTGKGTLIWGARTLAGNDNEWRFVSVRRLFNMIEESARKAPPSPSSSQTT